MSSDANPEPDPSGFIIYVGQDQAGHWLVQDSARNLEGRFVSYSAAMSYAKAERHIYHGTIELASLPLTPIVPFTPVQTDEHVLRRAA